MNLRTVVKFGGSNLKEADSIERLAKVIRKYEHPPVVIVSAFYGITNLLTDLIVDASTNEDAINKGLNKIFSQKQKIIYNNIQDRQKARVAERSVQSLLLELGKYLQGIHLIGEIPDFLYDKILSFGERLSSNIIYHVLNKQGIKCIESLPEEISLITDGIFGDANVDFEASERTGICKYFNKNTVYVVPGFYGVSQQGKVTLLGRGGSDYAAASIARLIGALSLDIWKDVNGFLSADPHLIDDAVPVKRLSYTEAGELAYFGAKILHPRTIEPIIDRHIPVRIFNIHRHEEGLQALSIINSEDSKTENVIKSITSNDDFGIIKLYGPGIGVRAGILAKITGSLNQNGINVKSVITSQISINILLSLKDLNSSQRIIRELNIREIQKTETLDDISLIALVGDGILEKPGIAARIFGAVAEKQVNVLLSSLGASNVICYLIVSKPERRKAIQEIHNEFFIKKTIENECTN